MLNQLKKKLFFVCSDLIPARDTKLKHRPAEPATSLILGFLL